MSPTTTPPHHLLPLAFLALLVFGCHPTDPPRDIILGDWKVDSTYSYYNGFARRQYREGADWATYRFRPDSTLLEIKFGTHRDYRYSIHGDTLFWDRESDRSGVHFRILALTPDRLVLRKDKPPLLPGTEQDRYEVRYFSRTDAPDDSVPFLPADKDSLP